MAEDLTGVLVAAAAGALLLRHAVVVHRHEQLGVTLQPDDGELAQSDIDPLALAAAAQLAVEATADAGGYVGQLAVAVVTLAHIHQFHVQDDGVYHFHYSGGQVALADVLLIQTVQRGLGREDLGGALAAEQDHPLVKDAQATDLHGPGSTHKGVGGDPVEVAHVNGVETAIEADRLHVDVDIQQLGLAGLDADGPLNGRLRTLGGIETQIFDAIFIGRYSVLYTAETIAPQGVAIRRVSAQKPVGTGWAWFSSPFGTEWWR